MFRPTSKELFLAATLVTLVALGLAVRQLRPQPLAGAPATLLK